jgi:DNA-binding SARP family transcriptional activator
MAVESPRSVPPDVELRLLGGFTAVLAGRRVADDAWTTRGAQLVQLLALAEGRRAPRDQVIEALFPHLSPEQGSANLRKAAHHARQALGIAEAVVLQGGEVLLLPGHAVSIDASDFEAAAHAALAAGDPAACAQAADRYAGELLPANRFDAWTEAPRTRLHARHLALLRAAGRLERIAEAEPADEPVHRELMRRALADGNRAEALRWYAHLRLGLQRELGVTPDAETEALYRQSIAGLPAAGLPFTGRVTELAEIDAWLATPRSLAPGGLVIRGPAGIGKSALAREVRGRARERGCTVVSIDAAEAGQPYAAIAATVERLLTDDRALLDALGPAARSVLAALSPVVGPVEPLPGPLGRHQVIGAFRRLLLAESRDEAVVLVVDDVHLLDDSDVDVLLQLITTGRPVSVVLAMRPVAEGTRLGDGLARLLRGNGIRVIDLPPLADAETAALVAQAAQGLPSPARVDAIVRRAGGNAFAAIELARCVLRSVDDPLPSNVREAIAARLCDVDETASGILRCLALAGDALDPAVALALSPADEGTTLAALDGALRTGVLVVNDGAYRFRHELVRQALVESIAPHRRLGLHREAARRLAAAGAPPATVARHWIAGGSLEEAVPCLRAAARDAVRVGAFTDALKHLGPLLGYRPDDAVGRALRAECLEAIGDPGAPAAFRAAAEVAAPEAADDLRAKGALAQVKQGDPKGALVALAGLRPSSVEGRLAEALAYSGAAALGFGDPSIGTRKAAESRRLALETGDTASIVIASWAQAAAAHARGELHSSVWADLQETRHVPHLAVRVFDGHLCITQRFLYGARPYDEVIAFADRLADEARRLGAARGEAFGVTLRGEAKLLGGSLDAAEADLREGGRLHRAYGGATGEALALQRRAELAMHRDRRDVARGLLDEALDLARATDIGFHLLDRIYGTRIQLETDPDAAIAAMEEAAEAVRGPLETCPGCRITFAVPAAIAAARARRTDLVEAWAPAVDYLADVVMRLPAWTAARDEVQAEIALAQGASPDAVRAKLAAAARLYTQAGHVLDAARCELRMRESSTGSG